jgi:hypothetical protein
LLPAKIQSCSSPSAPFSSLRICIAVPVERPHPYSYPLILRVPSIRASTGYRRYRPNKLQLARSSYAALAVSTPVACGLPNSLFPLNRRRDARFSASPSVPSRHYSAVPDRNPVRHSFVRTAKLLSNWFAESAYTLQEQDYCGFGGRRRRRSRSGQVRRWRTRHQGVVLPRPQKPRGPAAKGRG